MKTKITLSGLLILLFIGFSCQTNNQESAADTARDTETTDSAADQMRAEIMEEDSLIDAFREPSEEEIREYGIIQGIEDSGYPRFIVTMEFPEREMTAAFNLNIEAIAMDMEQLYALQGKYASIYYISEWENDLRDLQLNGLSVLGDEVYGDRAEWETVTGKLSGAAEETMSDLPGKISVTDEHGFSTDFEWYVNAEMVEANGKEVTAFYTFSGNSIITYIEPSEE